MKKGFTLLELIIVIVVIAVLASIALPQMISVIRKAKASEAITALTALRDAQLRYYADKQAKASDNVGYYANAIGDLDANLQSPRYHGAATVTTAAASVASITASDTSAAYTLSISDTGTITCSASTACKTIGY